MDYTRRYSDSLGIRQDWDSHKETLRSALKRAHQQRSFEIELLWKRGAFFWTFQAAIFAALGWVWSSLPKEPQGHNGQFLFLLVSMMGFLTALANSFAARGSKFWQENWEKHIDMLEDALEGSLHKTVWLKDRGVSYSVSAVSEALSDCFVAFWVFAVAYASWRFLGAPLPPLEASLEYIRPVVLLLCIAAMIFGSFWLWRKKTKLKGSLYARGIDPPVFYESGRTRVCSDGAFVKRRMPVFDGEDR